LVLKENSILDDALNLPDTPIDLIILPLLRLEIEHCFSVLMKVVQTGAGIIVLPFILPFDSVLCFLGKLGIN